MRKKMDFSGKTVIVTGGTYGIGGACAELFCECGASVAVCARNKQKGKAMEEKMTEKYGAGRFTFLRCDVKEEEEILQTVRKTVDRYGRIDVLVNNAGWHPMAERIDDVSKEMFHELIVTNLTSVFLFSKYCLPYLRKTRGSIVNMSSLVGSNGQRKALRYCVTKGGISAMTRALAIDEAVHGVRVNTISPGAIDTPLSASTTREGDNSAAAWSHMNRKGSAEEVAEVCLFLASEGASFLTGIDVPVSGGAELDYGCKIY